MAAANTSDYVVVARRYRPQQFNELVGQEHVARALEGAITAGRVGHAYLFTGARGVGKTSTARILAKALNCVNGPTPHPCDQCDSCLAISAGHDVDVLEIDGASNRGIDEIRQLRQNAGVRPSRSRFKIYIIDEVHMLTKEAFNALLKTLEEPPEHVKFIFATTEPEKLPVTVISRCQRFDFAGIRSDSITGRLRQIVEAEGVEADDDALALLARRAGGSMRDSQSLLEQLLSFGGKQITVADVHRMLGTASSSRMDALANAIAQRNAAAALSELDAALSEGADAGQILDQLQGYCRDLMVLAVGGDPSLLLQTDPAAVPNVQQVARDLGLPTILAMIQMLDQTQGRLRLSTSSRTLVELALVRLCSLENLSSLSSLIRQVADSSLPLGNAPAALPAAGQPSAAPPQQPAAQPAAAAQDTAPVDTPAPTGAPKKNEPAGHDGGSLAAEAAALAAATAAYDAKPNREEPLGVSAASQASGAAAATNTAEEAVQEPAAGAGQVELTPQNVAEVWKQAISELGVTLSEHASLYREIAILAPNHLAVRFPARYSLSKSLCEHPDNALEILEAMARITGRRPRIEYQLDPPEADSGPAAPAPRRRRMPNDLVREYSGHPLIQKATELFGARLTSVDEPSAER